LKNIYLFSLFFEKKYISLHRRKITEDRELKFSPQPLKNNVGERYARMVE
jgi:hypothetical protein